jgi:hypothetical protein
MDSSKVGQFKIAWPGHLNIYTFAILKLDFEKTVDKMKHNAILQVLQHKGFSDKWVSWIKSILDSGTSSVLLIGVLGKVFHCKRGVRQGDPLSPSSLS